MVKHARSDSWCSNPRAGPAVYRVKEGMAQPVAGRDAKAAQTQNCLGRMQRKQSSDA